MSVTLSSLRARVLVLLEEMDGKGPGDTVSVDQMIRLQYRAMEARLPAVWASTTGTVTITGGSATFTLPTTSSAEYEGGLRIRLPNGSFLERVSQMEMERLRGGGNAQGMPVAYSPFETSGQVVTCWVYPISSSTLTCDLFAAMVAADVSSTDVAATTLPLGRIAQDALIFKTAAAMARSPLTMKNLPADVRKDYRDVANVWDSEGDRLIYQEASRRLDLDSIGRVQRITS